MNPEYVAAIKRKDKQIEELERNNEVLRNTLMKKEQEILKLKKMLEKCQEAL